MIEAAKNYHVIVTGAGAVLQEKFTPVVLDKLGPITKRVIVDIEHGRLIDEETKNRSNLRVAADGLMAPFKIPAERSKDFVGIITTPEHLGVIKSFTEAGIRNFIVEKPLLNNLPEIEEFGEFYLQYPDLNVYPLDFYVQKAAPLLILTGAIEPDDPRFNWVVMGDGSPVPPKMSGSLEHYIGKIEGITTTIYEGGNFGLPDLAKRKWLEEDKLRGGALLDLGTHALTPLIASKIIPSWGTIDVVTAQRYIIGEDRNSYIVAPPNLPEMHCKAHFTFKRDGTTVPVEFAVGKTFEDGGIWHTYIRGSKGEISFGLRTGQMLTVIPRDEKPIQFKLKTNDPYGFAFKEADMFFHLTEGFGDCLNSMIASILIIESIKEKSP